MSHKKIYVKGDRKVKRVIRGEVIKVIDKCLGEKEECKWHLIGCEGKSYCDRVSASELRLITDPGKIPDWCPFLDSNIISALRQSQLAKVR